MEHGIITATSALNGIAHKEDSSVYLKQFYFSREI